MVWSPPEVAPPMSARERKQVYMHSTLFQAGQATSLTPYDPAHQRVVMDQVKVQTQMKPQRAEVFMPSPRDMKATMLQGYGAVQVGNLPRAADGGAVASQRYVSFGVGNEPMRMVPASRSDAIPREYAATSSTLNWSDDRNEKLRDQACRDSRKHLNASQRKVTELSSEVLGNTRRLEKSTEKASSEIQDCRLHHTPSRDLKEEVTARQQKSAQLSTSSENQFEQRLRSVSQDGRREAVMFKGKGTLMVKEDAQGEQRRRVERNYSDLFGNSTPRSAPRVRSDFHGVANACWMDAATETSARKQVQRQSDSRRAGQDGEGTMIYDPTTRSMDAVLPLSPRRAAQLSQEEKTKLKQERACWDVLPHGGFATGVEVARRRCDHRLRAHAKSTGALVDTELSASERKRVNLASGQLRAGTGAAKEPHDDGRPNELATLRTSRSTVSVPSSPSSRARGLLESSSMSMRNLHPPDSARGRKMKEMMSSEGIF